MDFSLVLFYFLALTRWVSVGFFSFFLFPCSRSREVGICKDSRRPPVSKNQRRPILALPILSTPGSVFLAFCLSLRKLRWHGWVLLYWLN